MESWLDSVLSQMGSFICTQRVDFLRHLMHVLILLFYGWFHGLVIYLGLVIATAQAMNNMLNSAPLICKKNFFKTSPNLNHSILSTRITSFQPLGSEHKRELTQHVLFAFPSLNLEREINTPTLRMCKEPLWKLPEWRSVATCYLLKPKNFWVPLVAQMVKNPPAI